MAPVLKSFGFRKTGATWRKQENDAISVINLQGSQWSSEDFYINLGVYFSALGDEHHPTENRCHIRIRLDRLVPQPEELDNLLNLQESMPATERASRLETLLRKYAIPWLAGFTSIQRAKEQVHQAKVDRQALVTLAAKQFLGAI